MIAQDEVISPLKKVVGWVAINLLAVVLFFVSLNLMENLLIPGQGFVTIVFDLSFGIFISAFQALFLRLSHIETPGSTWLWITSGFFSSIIGALVNFGFLVVFMTQFSDATNLPTAWEIGVYYLGFIASTRLFLGMVQSFILSRKRYKKAMDWFFINFIGYTLVIGAAISFIYSSPLPQNASARSALMVLAAMLFAFVEIAGAWVFFRVLDTVDAGENPPAYPKTIRSGRGGSFR